VKLIPPPVKSIPPPTDQYFEVIYSSTPIHSSEFEDDSSAVEGLIRDLEEERKKRKNH
jgi:hypothetical protein